MSEAQSVLIVHAQWCSEADNMYQQHTERFNNDLNY